ncbi:MAG: hypothetical protein RLZZ232_942 [Planctomycetota bacterium]|jgi:hypothetical protein
MSQVDAGFGGKQARVPHSAATGSAQITVLSKSALTGRRIFPEA